ncbi:penicillin-binding protein activator [Inquilinus sp. Marseille-Q2685]|uniref:penicillin-binding protein activator n=1 Tax=Inquilinus sp. Marseille-Q2685 TaxID=2866581 RepID=UPI001CE4505B|nr:penicillin-binding protein activator [Inquilinus sp. Marseille-Q2685]
MTRLATVSEGVEGEGRARLRRLVRLAGAAAMAAALAACAQFQTVPRPTPITQAPTAPSASTRPDDGVLRVGLLLPLTGGSAALGEAMQRAAQMAVFDTGTQVELLPRDTGDSPNAAGEAARSAIAQGADIILGPLFSKSVAPVAQQARAAGINVVAFSTDTAQAGGNVFLLSFLPQQAIDRIVGYGASQGMRRFALLAPRSAYGQIVSRALTEAAIKYNVEAPVIELYDSKLSDPTPLQQKLQSSQVDAVIVADVGSRLSVVAPMLGYSGVTAKLMGTGQWDDPQVNRQSYLAGAWYAAPDPSRRADFESRYAQQFGGPPPRLATLAYDAVALTAALAGQPASGGNPFNTTALQDPNGFVGIDGIFRFGPNGLVQRGLAVLQAEPTGPTVVEAAPDSFSGAAF